jgi:NAD(P)-dependent dehydrogenase (short-subunit alcohol dehydrogenase family)
MELTGLKGKTAIVTGASRGIGKAIAEHLARSGVRVVCSATSEDTLKKTCQEIERNGGVALPVKADVTSDTARKHLINQAISKFGSVDILINNAGIVFTEETVASDDKKIMTLMQTNFFSVYSLSRDIAKHMIKSGHGKIVNIGSLFGQIGVPMVVAYCSSKGAVASLTRSLAVEWAPHNIQVNAIAPGYIWTDMCKAVMENNEQMQKDTLAKIPANRFGTPEDVASSAVFLCSEQADYITGTLHFVDGGAFIQG